MVCPPSLCLKWQREMREQFGLGFEIVDTEHVHRLRRERGVGVNPFRSHPRLIVSMEWLKFESQMRWFDEFLPPDPNVYPRAFDLLIVDEAHRIAPSAVGRYAKDSLRTKAMRRLAPHFEHRLFLTATPHNGYPESFQALLEMLDPNRFTKGVPPSERERDAVMVRRLKSHLRTMLPDGAKRFPKRRIAAIDVVFPPEERELFELLDSYTALCEWVLRACRLSGRHRGSSRCCSRSGCCRRRPRSSTLSTSTSERSTRPRIAGPTSVACRRPPRPSMTTPTTRPPCPHRSRRLWRWPRVRSPASIATQEQVAVGKDACQNGEHRRGDADS